MGDSSGDVYIVYKRRWYIIGMFSLVAFLQCFYWIQWGPMYKSLAVMFNFGDAQIALLPFYGTVAFALLVMPIVWLVEKFGIRKTVVAMTTLVWLAVAMRCVPIDNTILQTVLINISAVFAGIAGATTFFMPPAISARWFPPNERKLATAIGELLNGFGVCASFLIGPYAVPDPASDSAADRKITKAKYFHYTYAEMAVTTVVFIMVLIYFPSKPPTPPSSTAENPRNADVQSMIAVLKMRDFWMISVPVTLIFGSFSGWQPVLGVCLQQNGMDQQQAGWIGCWSSFASLITGLLAGKIADLFPKYLKAIIVALTLLTFEGIVYILLLTQNFIRFTLLDIYFAVILTSAASGAMMPLLIELTAEVCYPADEATLSGFMGCFINAMASVFLAGTFLPNSNLSWMSWFLIVACGISTPWTFFVPSHYRRSEADHYIEPEPEDFD